MTIIIFLTTGKHNSHLANPVIVSRRIIPITVLYKKKPLNQPHQSADASEIQELTADSLEAIRPDSK